MEQEPPSKRPRLLPAEEPKDNNNEKDQNASIEENKLDSNETNEKSIKLEQVDEAEPQASSEQAVGEGSNITESQQSEQQQQQQQVLQPQELQQQETQQKESEQQQKQHEEEQQQQQQRQQQEIDALAAAHLQQMNVAQAQALAQAAAAAVSANGETNYHQLFANLDASTAFAAAMAAVNSNSTEDSSQASNNTQLKPDNTNSSAPQVDMNQSAAEILKRELMNQKVRADNRERKKRWRLQNEERNKDNDLRCRVNKRAHKLFGKDDSEHKQRWIDEEFLKRQQKRKEKERRKGLVDDSLGAHNNNLQSNPGLDLATLAQQLVPQQQPLQMTESNYLTLLCNNLGIPAVARSLITGNIPTTGTTNPEISAPVEPSTSSSTTTATAATTTAEIAEGEGERSGDSKDKVQQFPFQLLELLQQLQQYQPQNQSTSEAVGTSESADFQLTTQNNSNAPFNTSASNALTDNDDARPEEKLAALLTSTLQAASAAAATSLTETKEGEIKEEADQGGEGGSNQQQQQQQQNTEFPMDAVLTLMQLNAGWRQ